MALPRIYLGYRIPPFGSDEFYTADVLAHVLAGGKSTRLYRSLVREQRVAKDVGAAAFPLVTGATLLIVSTTGNPDTAPEALEAALLAEMEAVRSAPDLGREIERAVTGIEARHVIGLQQVSERANDLSMYATQFGDPERINTELDRYRAVTGERVRRFALELLGADNRAVLTYVPLAAREAA